MQSRNHQENLEIVFNQIPTDPAGLGSKFAVARSKNYSQGWDALDDNEKRLVSRAPRFDNTIGAPGGYDFYNMNKFEHWLGEGPAWGKKGQSDITQAAQYFFALLANNISTILIAGDPFDRRVSGFLAYFIPESAFGPEAALSKYSTMYQNDKKVFDALKDMGIEIVPSDTYDTNDTNLKNTNVTIKFTKDQRGNPLSEPHVLNLAVQQISKLPDFETCPLSFDEMKSIRKTLELGDGVYIHCGAGVGRTGIMECMHMWSKDSKLISDDYVPNLEMIAIDLIAKRGTRPEFVQREKQFQMAIEGAALLKFLKNNPNATEQDYERAKKDIDGKVEKAFADRAQKISPQVVEQTQPQSQEKRSEVKEWNPQPLIVDKKTGTPILPEKWADEMKEAMGDRGEQTVNLIKDLSQYIKRIESHQLDDKINFKHGFKLFKNSQSKNREANYHLAQKLIEQLYKYPDSYGEVISQRNINNIRDQNKNCKLSPTAIFALSELHGILEQARSPARDDIKIRRKP